MAHRDDREAQHARIEALERDLRDAKERAERAERDAADARTAASEGSKRDARAAATTSTKTRAERKREKAQRDAASSARGPASSLGWTDAGRRVYRRASFVLALLAYGSVAAFVPLPPAGLGAAEGTIASVAGVALAVLLAGHTLLGFATRAPGVFNGAVITLLAVAVPFGTALLATVALEDFVPATLRGLLHALVALVSVVLGAVVTAAWTSDAASSASTGSD